jgi:hypothetical protein
MLMITVALTISAEGIAGPLPGEECLREWLNDVGTNGVGRP